MARKGWIKLWHKLAEDPMWLESKFTPGQAWVDLLLMACVVTDQDHQPGQVCCSVLYLANRWKWSRSTVNRYLDRLEKAEMITRQKNGHKKGQCFGHLLTIEKYRRYQIGEQQNEHKNEQVSEHIEEDTQRVRPLRGAHDKGSKRTVPEQFRDRFATYEEFEDWRNQ